MAPPSFATPTPAPSATPTPAPSYQIDDPRQFDRIPLLSLPSGVSFRLSGQVRVAPLSDTVYFQNGQLVRGNVDPELPRCFLKMKQASSRWRRLRPRIVQTIPVPGASGQPSAGAGLYTPPEHVGNLAIYHQFTYILFNDRTVEGLYCRDLQADGCTQGVVQGRWVQNATGDACPIPATLSSVRHIAGSFVQLYISPVEELAEHPADFPNPTPHEAIGK